MPPPDVTPDAPFPDQPVALPLPTWYERLGKGGQFFMQLGFAGLFAVVFLWQQYETNRQAKEERAILWEELRTQRIEQRDNREELRKAVDAMNRAVDEFRRCGKPGRPDGQ
jgi:hypothetical protein